MPEQRVGRHPDVSIVIPVFNQLELTRACVDAILRHGATATFEIVVVDNGSGDGTADWLAAQADAGALRAVSPGENLGFARGCNAGAEAARGRHLLFLNNDTEVTEGWLEPLVQTLERDPRAGIVGARLLFADGTLQHAGVALVDTDRPEGPTLEGMHLAYRKPADFPGAARPLKLRIVTGACLLTRAALFRELGGFDSGYWNGMEDVDYCLRAAESGWDAVYRPESLVFHYEAQSGPERWSRALPNIRRFNERWRSRARPDFLRTADGRFNATAAHAIGPWIEPRLARAKAAPTAADPVVSVIVLTWNALDYTRRCAESLLRHTDPRHELIFVDNGSAPETLAYLSALAASQPRVRTIFNGENLGFAAGNNVGLAAARGDCFCLLNSDTVVTDGWLERQLAVLAADPGVGLVGPMTNSITGPQKLPAVPYDEDTLAGLDDFAADLAAREAGRRDPALWVVGFCVLLRRELVERLGGLDVRFGQGNYEDTDYCLRAFLGGWRSAIARDAFVHHFGSRSFVAGQVDYARQLDAKWEIFRRKWDLDPQVRRTGNLDLEALVRHGYLPALHFHPLPAGDGVRAWPLAAWEAARWLETGELLFQEDRLTWAEEVFRAVLREAPDNARAASDLACALWRQVVAGRAARPADLVLREAETLLEAALARDPENQDARWNLQEIRERGGALC